MSFRLYLMEQHIAIVSYAELPAARAVRIERLSMGVIPHDITIKNMAKTPILLVGSEYALLNWGLLVASHLVMDGKVETKVMNLTNMFVRVAAGQSVSCLVAL